MARFAAASAAAAEARLREGGRESSCISAVDTSVEWEAKLSCLTMSFPFPLLFLPQLDVGVGVVIVAVRGMTGVSP